jgi:cyclic beta-1,2-glucan synthetase
LRSPTAFADLGEGTASWTGDRDELIGRNGVLAAPAALRWREPLSGAAGAGLDPCGGLQRIVELAPGEVREVIFLLDEADGDDAARDLVPATGPPTSTTCWARSRPTGTPSWAQSR